MPVNALIGLATSIVKFGGKVTGKVIAGNVKAVTLKINAAAGKSMGHTAGAKALASYQHAKVAAQLKTATAQAHYLNLHSIPAKAVTLKTSTGVKVILVTAKNSPVIVQGVSYKGAAAIALTLVKAKAGKFAVVATPHYAVAGAALKGTAIAVGKVVVAGGAVILGLIGGAGM